MSLPHSRSSSSSSSSPLGRPHATSSSSFRRSRPSPRASKLPPSMQSAVSTFTARVGPPRHVQPAGFRDFRGWLLRLNSRQSQYVWDELFSQVSLAAGGDVHAIHLHKADIVRSIIRTVVKPRADESSKLVSTNAGRQAGKPRGSGSTLMSVLDEQLVRWQRASHMASSPAMGPYSGMFPSPGRTSSVPPSRTSRAPSLGRTSSPIGKRGRDYSYGPSRSASVASADRLPSVQQLLSGTPVSPSQGPLPSFQELDQSIARRASSARSHAHHRSSRHGYHGRR